MSQKKPTFQRPKPSSGPTPQSDCTIPVKKKSSGRWTFLARLGKFWAALSELDFFNLPRNSQNQPKDTRQQSRCQSRNVVLNPTSPLCYVFLTEVLYYCHSIKWRAGSTKYISRWAIRSAQLCVAHFWLICTILGSLRQLYYSSIATIVTFPKFRILTFLKNALTPNIYSGINVIGRAAGPLRGKIFWERLSQHFGLSHLVQ